MDELTAERFRIRRVPAAERTRKPLPLLAEIERRHGVWFDGVGCGGPDTPEAVWRRRRILLNLPVGDIQEAA